MTDEATNIRAIRAAGVAGLVFAALMTTSLALFRAEPAGGDRSRGRYSRRRQGASGSLALYLVPFAGIAFVWFLAALRRRIGRLEDQFFATVFLASGLLFVAMLFATGAVGQRGSGRRAARERIPSNQAVFEFGRVLAETLFYVFAVKMAAAFMLVSSTIGRRTGFLPRWFIVVGLVAGIVMLFSISFFEVLAVIFPAWVAIVSVLSCCAPRQDALGGRPGPCRSEVDAQGPPGAPVAGLVAGPDSDFELVGRASR